MQTHNVKKRFDFLLFNLYLSTYPRLQNGLHGNSSITLTSRQKINSMIFCMIESHGLFQDRETLILSCWDSWEPQSTHAETVFKLPSRLQPLSFVQKSFNDFSWWDKKRQLPHFKALAKTPRSRSIMISRYKTSNPIESDGLVAGIRQ